MRALLAWCLLAALGCQKSPPPAPISEALRRSAADLQSSEQADWREAQLLLAREAPASLQALEGLAAGGAVRVERLLSVLDLALRWNTTAEDLQRWPTLASQAAPALARGQAQAALLADRREFDPAEPALAELRRLGGLAVPAALMLTRHGSPLARAWGVRVLLELNAPIARARLVELSGDMATYTLQGSRGVGGQGTVGALAAEALQRLEVPADQRHLAFERQLLPVVGQDLELISVIRARTTASQARTWDEYWERARGVWRVYWQLVPEGALQPADLEAWRNHWNRVDGFFLERAAATAGAGVLRVVGPPGATAVLTQNGAEVASGPLPLTLERTPLWPSTVLVVQWAGGKRFTHELRFDRGEDLTVTVLP